MTQQTLKDLQIEIEELLKKYPGYKCVIFHEDDRIVDVLNKW